MVSCTVVCHSFSTRCDDLVDHLVCYLTHSLPSPIEFVAQVLVAQKYGRVVVTCSPAMYGSGVEAYAASKTGLIGLASSLQFEA